LWLAVDLPYSLDLVSSELFLFENVTHFIQGMFFESREEFLAVIHGIMATIPTKNLYGVCEY
jgi:hypothetical protein